MAQAKKRKLNFSHSLLVKTMAVLILLFIIPILVLYSLMMKDSTSRIINDVSSRISVSMQNLSSTMDEIFTSVETVCNQMRADTVFGEISFTSLISTDQNSYDAFLLREQVSRTLYRYYLSNSYIHSLDVYNPYCNTIFTSGVGNTRKTVAEPDEESIQRVMGPEGRQEKQWFLQQENGKHYLVTYFSPYYSHRPTLKLYARIALPVDILLSRFESLFPDDQAELVIRDASQRFTALTGTDVTLAVPDMSFEGKEGWMDFQDGETMLTVYRHSDYTSWLYVTQAPVSRFSTAFNVLADYLYYFIFCLAFILVVCMIFLYAYIIRPMQKISSTMRQAEHGDLSVRIDFRQKDELGYVGHRFNVLLENIQNLIQENYAARMRKNEFELKFIQTQLKEHFIYNTLDSIHWIANRHKVPQISTIIFKLSHFFRLTLNHGKELVTVQEACEILDCYLSLVNVRMDNMIQFDIDVEPGLENEQVVKYLFQPVVENAFQHGIRSREKGVIHVSIHREGEDMILYQVEDDGIGMTEERLEDVRYAIAHHTTRSASDSCFALISIDRQLKMYFADRYSFTIHSVQNEGTRVTLIFPLGKEVHSHAENDHH